MTTNLNTEHWSWLRCLSFALYQRECEWAQNGIYLILGYRAGDNLPWWSPARITIFLTNMIESQMSIGRLTKLK